MAIYESKYYNALEQSGPRERKSQLGALPHGPSRRTNVQLANVSGRPPSVALYNGRTDAITDAAIPVVDIVLQVLSYIDGSKEANGDGQTLISQIRQSVVNSESRSAGRPIQTRLILQKTAGFRKEVVHEA